MNLILFILACYGMTMIMVYGRIFNKIRPKYHFFHCTMCTGFWVGLFINLCLIYTNKQLFDNFYIGMLLSGCISSGTSYLLSRIVDDEGIKINLKKDL